MKTKVTVDFERGARAAASLASEYDGCSSHKYRLEDCILGKLNLRGGRPRLNRRRSPPDAIEAARLRGAASALTKMLYATYPKAGDRSLCAISRALGLTSAKMREAGVPDYEIRVLRRFGIR